MNIVLVAWLVLNVVSFVMYGVDKWKSKRAKWRIPEATLIWMAVFGGSVGALLAMRCFRHKTQHAKFRYGIPAILLAQLMLAGYLLWELR